MPYIFYEYGSFLNVIIFQGGVSMRIAVCDDCEGDALYLRNIVHIAHWIFGSKGILHKSRLKIMLLF